MIYSVYIIYSKSKDMFYRGHTSDITDRLIRHNGGREKATAIGLPWLLLWCTQKSNKSEAYRLEMKLKNLSRERLIEFMLKYEDDIAGPDALLFLKQWSGC